MSDQTSLPWTNMNNLYYKIELGCDEVCRWKPTNLNFVVLGIIQERYSIEKKNEEDEKIHL